MSVTWSEIDIIREKCGLSKAALARRAGIPENTIHRGLRNNSALNPSTLQVVEAALAKARDERFRDLQTLRDAG